MAARTTLSDPLTNQQQWQVTAYLVALSPQLQRSVRQLREEQERRNETKQAAAEITAGGEQPSSYDREVARQLFETKCSECHETTLVEEDPPDSEAGAQDLVTRMVEEGLTASEEELSQIVRYLVETYVKKSGP
jgi:mono/diheme cytochrome c family protein